MKHHITSALAVTLLVLVFSSCGKEKKPVSVGISLNVTGTSSGTNWQPGYLEFTTGHLFINQYSVLGDREKGDDIVFTRDVNQQVVINAPSTVFTDQFDLMQGDYSMLNIQFELANNGNSNAIYLFGNYTDQNMITFQVQLKINATHVLGKNVSKSGVYSFSLAEGNTENVDFILDLATLFSVITASDWQSAQHQGWNPFAPVFIDDVNNQQLYSLIVNQLPFSITATFR